MGHTMSNGGTGYPTAQAIPTNYQNRTSYNPIYKQILPTYRHQIGVTGKFQNHYLGPSFRNQHNY